MEDMTLMDKIWVATALQIYPDVDCKKCISKSQIISKVTEMFNIEETPTMSRYLNAHLVSSVKRNASIKYPAAGGSRNRYLFRTNDGIKANNKGKYRLYKSKDKHYDEWEKTAKTYPNKKEVNEEFYDLIEWYENNYFNSE